MKKHTIGYVLKRKSRIFPSMPACSACGVDPPLTQHPIKVNKTASFTKTLFNMVDEQI